MSKHTSLIEKYLANQLSPDERSQFEAQCQADPELTQELKLEMQVRYTTEHVGNQLLREQLKADLHTFLPKPERKSITFQRYWAVAAVILILILSIPFITDFGSNPSLPELYAEHVLHEDFSPANMRRAEGSEPESAMDSMWNQAASFAEQQQFPQAIETIKGMLENPALNSRNKALYYLGIAYLKNENVSEAIGTLKQIDPDELFGDQAEWYLVLIYMKQDDASNAERYIRQVAGKEGHYRQETAQDLLSQLF